MADGLISFLLLCFVVELTPGPNMAYLTMVSSLHGRKSGLSMVAGVATGLFIVGLVAAAGAAALVLESPALYHALRGAGIFYLLWLAWDSWRMPLFSTEMGTHFDQRSFWRGFVTNILNPKAWMFYVTVFPTFIDTSRPFLAQALVMTAVYVMIATAVHSSIVLLGEWGGQYLHRPVAMKAMRAIFSGLLVGLAAWFAWSTRLLP